VQEVLVAGEVAAVVLAAHLLAAVVVTAVLDLYW
jgi:hypothetical protein